MLFITATDLFTSQCEALVKVLNLTKIKKNTNFAEEHKYTEGQCHKLFPLLDIKACPVDVSLNDVPLMT